MCSVVSLSGTGVHGHDRCILVNMHLLAHLLAWGSAWRASDSDCFAGHGTRGKHEEEVTHDAIVAMPTHASAPAPPVKITVLGSWWAALLLVCTTLMTMASAFTAFILYVRPVLQVLLHSLLLKSAVRCTCICAAD